VTDDRRNAPLAGFADAFAAAASDAVRVVERPFLAQVGVRVFGARSGVPDPAGLSAAEAALGFPLPAEPNSVAGAGGTDVLWLGPDEWLVVGARDVRHDLQHVRLRRVLLEHFCSERAGFVQVAAAEGVIDLGHRAVRGAAYAEVRKHRWRLGCRRAGTSSSVRCRQRRVRLRVIRNSRATRHGVARPSGLRRRGWSVVGAAEHQVQGDAEDCQCTDRESDTTTAHAV